MNSNAMIKAVVENDMCIGCGMCVKKCPFSAITIINLPTNLEKDTTHRYSANSFKLHRLPIPRPGQVLGLVGTNGIGKSTLLKTIAGSLPLLGGELKWGHSVISGYLPQNHLEELDEKETVLENILRANRDLSDGAARSILGQFQFRKDDAFKLVGVLSGGEKSRVSLSCMMARQPNFMMLDEPTNHLDMASTDILAQALAEYTGTVLFVSHNRHFINHVATHIFVVADGKQHRLFEGGLEDYQIGAERQGFPNILKA